MKAEGLQGHERVDKQTTSLLSLHHLVAFSSLLIPSPAFLILSFPPHLSFDNQKFFGVFF
jgi:hypothetical protein